MYNFSCILFYSCIIFLPHYSGFELAGLAPFSVRTIFQQGTSWGKIPEEDAQRLIATIPTLAVEVRKSDDGACSDLLIQSLLGDIVSTEMIGIDDKVLNQKRAVWLTPEKARNIFKANSEKAEKERVAVIERTQTKERAATAKRANIQNASRVAEGGVEGKKETACIAVNCNNECGNVRKAILTGVQVPYDGWLGCTSCANWYCYKVNCKKRFKKHHAHCLTIHA